MSFSNGQDQELNIIVRLRDLASKEMKQLEQNVKQANTRLKEAEEHSKAFALGLTAVVAAGGALGYSMLKAAADLEQTKVAFETMTGSGEKAQKFIEDLTTFAKNTPFTLQGLEESSKRLLAYGYDVSQVLPTLEVLGNIAAGVGTDKMPQLILALGQVKAATHLTGMELRQFSEAGVPLIDELAKHFGVSASEIQKMVSNGEVGFQAVEQALKNLSGEGGRFEDLMSKQSKTLGGMVSNLQDAWNIFLRNEGQKLLDWAKAVVQGLIYIVQNVLPKMIDGIDKLVQVSKDMPVIIGAIGGAIMGALVPATWAAVRAFVAAAIALGPFAIGGAVIGAAIVGIYAITKRLGGFKNAMMVLKEVMIIVGYSIIGTIQAMVEGVLKWINKGSEKLEEWYNKAVDLANKAGIEMEKVDLTINTDIGSSDTFAKAGEAYNRMQGLIQSATEAQTDANVDLAASNFSVDTSMLGVAAGMGRIAGDSADAGKAATKLANAVENLNQTYSDLEQEVGDKLQALKDAHRENLDKARSKIRDLKKDLSDLKKTYSATMADLNTNFASNESSDKKTAAEAVVAQEQKVADLKQKIKEAQTDKERILLNEQLTKEQQALTDNAAFISSIQGQVDEERRRASLTDFQRAVEDYNSKRALAVQEFEAKRSEAKAEYDAKKKEIDAAIAEQQRQMAEEKKAYQQKELLITAFYLQAQLLRMQGQLNAHKQTVDLVNDEIAAYNQLAKAIQRAYDGKSTSQYVRKYEFGGIVPGAKGQPVPIIAHGQERIIPAGKTSSGGDGGGYIINIDIGNVNASTAEETRRFKRVLEDALRPILQDNKLTTT